MLPMASYRRGFPARRSGMFMIPCFKIFFFYHCNDILFFLSSYHIHLDRYCYDWFHTIYILIVIIMIGCSTYATCVGTYTYFILLLYINIIVLLPSSEDTPKQAIHLMLDWTLECKMIKCLLLLVWRYSSARHWQEMQVASLFLAFTDLELIYLMVFIKSMF